MHLSYAPTGNNRIEIADVLRGFAVLGITLIHFIERFSLYSYPEETCNLLLFTDKVIWDSVFFAFSGKAYCIFALLYITIEKYTIFQLKSIPVLIVCEDKKSYLNAG